MKGEMVGGRSGACYLLLYDEPGGVLLDVSRPFYRTDTDRLVGLSSACMVGPGRSARTMASPIIAIWTRGPR